MLEDIRTYARLQLAVATSARDAGAGHDMTREQYIAAVLSYAVEKHGDGQDTKMHAERTARYMWAMKREPSPVSG